MRLYANVKKKTLNFLPSLGVFATVSLCFESSFANIYLFHIFLSASARKCLTVAAAGQLNGEAESEL